MGIADGVATIFSLRYENYIAGTLTVYLATPPAAGSGSTPAWVAQSPSSYVIGSTPNPTQTGATNAIITFNTAPAANKMVGARYQATAFSDTDLTGYLTRAQQTYTDDTSVIKCVQYDIIDVVLLDYNRMILLAQGNFRTDPVSYAASLRALATKLRADLQGRPNPGANSPVMMVASTRTRRYQPLR
ncbi:MAG TPA: hypothetical protein VHR97_01700 [Candidatus Baltobacteraceae bacterium]|jgi:hypothetical protein|nr:hypothetical protein [Candidatus Baltobacteraceae bacterium]